MSEIKKDEYLEIVENLLEMCARREIELAELQAQLDVFKPKNVDLHVIDKDKENVHGKVLLIFESKTLRDILKTMLEKSGSYDVIVIDKYEDAPSSFALHKPDICVIEHGTYGAALRCLDIINEIRNMSTDVGLISILPENDVNTIRAAAEAGVDDFLVKPIDTLRMNHIINDILKNRRSKKAV